MVTKTRPPRRAAQVMRRCGVCDAHDLIRVASQGDHHEELKNVGVSTLGARSKIGKFVAPYWDALGSRQRANGLYTSGCYAEAVGAYTAIIDSLRCPTHELALMVRNNRAAAYLADSQPQLALRDLEHVLAFDPENSKAQARRKAALGIAGSTPLSPPPALQQPAATRPRARLGLARLRELQEEALADDVEIDLERMDIWTEDEARSYFESGGEVAPPPPPA
jgi:hypothetical protein